MLFAVKPFLRRIVLFTLVLAGPVTVRAQTAGATVFASSGCTHCHGATGEGGDLGPSLREVHRKLRPAQVQKQIVEGGGEMPAFGQSLTPEQVQALVKFLRAKTWVQAPPTAASH